MRKMPNIAKKLLPFLLAATLLIMPIKAMTPYESYRYDYWGKPVPAPHGYEPERTYSSDEIGTSPFLTPSDIFYSPAGEFYIADTGNNRIVVTDGDFRFQREYSEFYAPEKTHTLNAPQGVFVDSDNVIYIADSDNHRVLVSDQSGRVLHEIEQPQTDIFPENLPFKPVKISKDSHDTLYVLVENMYYGAVAYNKNGEFQRFFGSNRVNVTPAQLISLVWRKIFSHKKKDTIERYVPVAFSNICVDQDNFIYTCTKTMNTLSKLKKLNAAGENVLNTVQFGDSEVVWTRTGVMVDTQFVDLTVDHNGYISALDFERGRIFQYDSEGNLMFIFGGKGVQSGLFMVPSAIESMGDRLIVLDSEKKNVTVFAPTTYALKVRAAMELYNKGLYDQAVEPWKDILRIDGNDYFAHSSLGKAYFDMGKYKDAMSEFYLGQDREGYSRAYNQYRTDYIRDRFVLFSIALILLIAAFFLMLKRQKVRALLVRHGLLRPKTNQIIQRKGFHCIGYILFHPIDGYEELAYHKSGRISISLLILAAWFVGTVLQYQFTGFIFNTRRIENLNVLLLFATSVFPAVLWAISNWCFCSLLDGKGTFKNIFIFNIYALTPYVISLYITILLSNVFVLEEGAFLNILLTVGIAWSMFLVFCAVKVVHHYSSPKTFVSIFLTAVGVLVIVFLLSMCFSLIQQVVSFVKTIMQELQYRFY